MISMVDVEALRQEELESIETNVSDDVYELESLITDGTDARIPIVISYPKNGKMVKASALIRPVNGTEWNNVTRLIIDKDTKQNPDVVLVKMGLYTSDDKPFTDEMVDKIPAGAIIEISKKIAEVSGITIDRDTGMDLVKNLVGF